MVEMDSAPSKTFRAPKNMKFYSVYLDLQKSLPYFFFFFLNMMEISITFTEKNIIVRLWQ